MQQLWGLPTKSYNCVNADSDRSTQYRHKLKRAFEFSYGSKASRIFGNDRLLEANPRETTWLPKQRVEMGGRTTLSTRVEAKRSRWRSSASLAFALFISPMPNRLDE